MLHTSLWQNEDFAKLSDKAKILYIGTITIADDDGKLKGNSLLLKGQVFPLDEKVTSEHVRQYLNELVKAKLVNFYKIENQYFIQHPNWKKFQVLRKDLYKPSSIPDVTDASRDRNGDVTDAYPKLSKDKLSKVNNARKRAAPKKKIDDHTPMTLLEYVKWMKSSDQRHIQIIGEWAEAEGPQFTTRAQWESFTARNVRISKTLTPYSTAQIEKAYGLMMGDVVRLEGGKKVGFITKYTLETLTKYIDRI